ncbi:MAG: hypothetical protein ACOYD7_06855 [Raoultibacter sp.]
MVDFKKEISFGKKPGAKSAKKNGSYPTKTKINLVSSGAKQENRTTIIALFLVFIVLLAIFVKFAVIDPLASVEASNKRVQTAQTQLNDLKAQNSSMSELGDQYSKYVVAGMTPEETELVNRTEIVDLIRTKIMGTSVLSSVKISGNTVAVTCQGISLQDASVVVRNIEQDERVSHVTVSTAQEKDGSAATATFEIMLKSSSELAAQRVEQQIAAEREAATAEESQAEKGASNGN